MFLVWETFLWLQAVSFYNALGSFTYESRYNGTYWLAESFSTVLYPYDTSCFVGLIHSQKPYKSFMSGFNQEAEC